MSAARALDRTEWLLLTVLLAGALFGHWGSISWPRFVLAFVAIDLIGYLPGALAFRKARGGSIAPFYHWLYNLTHNFITAAVVVSARGWALGRVEWAMLAIPPDLPPLTVLPQWRRLRRVTGLRPDAHLPPRLPPAPSPMGRRGPGRYHPIVPGSARPRARRPNTH